jgi:hypothetical protein
MTSTQPTPNRSPQRRIRSRLRAGLLHLLMAELDRTAARLLATIDGNGHVE